MSGNESEIPSRYHDESAAARRERQQEQTYREQVQESRERARQRAQAGDGGGGTGTGGTGSGDTDTGGDGGGQEAPPSDPPDPGITYPGGGGGDPFDQPVPQPDDPPDPGITYPGGGGGGSGGAEPQPDDDGAAGDGGTGDGPTDQPGPPDGFGPPADERTTDTPTGEPDLVGTVEREDRRDVGVGEAVLPSTARDLRDRVAGQSPAIDPWDVRVEREDGRVGANVPQDRLVEITSERTEFEEDELTILGGRVVPTDPGAERVAEEQAAADLGLDESEVTAEARDPTAREVTMGGAEAALFPQLDVEVSEEASRGVQERPFPLGDPTETEDTPQLRRSIDVGEGATGDTGAAQPFGRTTDPTPPDPQGAIDPVDLGVDAYQGADALAEEIYDIGRGDAGPSVAGVPVAAPFAAGTATPEPVSTAAGLAGFGAIAAGTAAYELQDIGDERSEIAVGEGAGAVTATEVGLGSGAVTETELGLGEGTTATEVGLGSGAVTTTEVGLGETFGSEIAIGSGAAPAGEAPPTQGSGDSVVPGEYPQAGRDFPANPRREYVPGSGPLESAGQQLVGGIGAGVGQERGVREITEEDIADPNRLQRERREDFREQYEQYQQDIRPEERPEWWEYLGGGVTFPAEEVADSMTPTEVEPEVTPEQAAEQATGQATGQTQDFDLLPALDTGTALDPATETATAQATETTTQQALATEAAAQQAFGFEQGYQYGTEAVTQNLFEYPTGTETTTRPPRALPGDDGARELEERDPPATPETPLFYNPIAGVWPPQGQGGNTGPFG